MELTYDQKVLLNNAAKRSFRDMADQDYLTARVCFKNNLPFQFLWMSQQAIEKYIKCILLSVSYTQHRAHETLRH
ncbi:HEPN domain-containing protein, partial [Citrobacter freundii]